MLGSDKSSKNFRYKRCHVSECNDSKTIDDQIKMPQLFVLFLDTNVQVRTDQSGRKYVKKLNVKFMSQYARSIQSVVGQAEISDTRKIVSLADY